MSVKYAILNALMWITLLAFPLQCIIDPSAENVASVCIVLVSSLSLLAYLKWSGSADAQPLSTVALFGFCVTTQLGALLVQTAYWTPIRFSLYNPLLTFGTLAFYLAIAVLMHVVYRFFSRPAPGRVGLVRGFLSWLGIYQVPPSSALWFMGCFGLISFPFSAHEGVVARVASGFNFLTWAPFLLPLFIREVGPAYCNARRNRLFLVLYTGMVIILGIALNVRVVMFIGLATVGLLYLLFGMRSNAPLTRKSVARLCILAALLAALSPSLSDLATSMAIARGARGKVSPVEMVRKTISVWRRPALIAEYNRERTAVSRFAAYDEHYIENPLLARFVETKFHDNALHFAGALTTEESKEQLRKVTIDATWSALPTPLLKALHIGVNKDDMNFSMGDYLAYLSRGVPLGGRKTGSVFAQGMALMGVLFPILYAATCLLLYGLMDLLTIRSASGRASLSPLAMMSMWMFFYRGITSDALSNQFVFVVRDFGQTVLIYVVMFGIARVMFGGYRPTRASPVAPGWHQATYDG
ncbi:MAG: hypothetical protein ABSH33_14620 [Steroidobacteraceae bacterium]|jgi:hypothetical protein